MDFFTHLFKGHHITDGSIQVAPFQPNFDKIDDFLQDVGKLDDRERDLMIADINPVEVEEVIK